MIQKCKECGGTLFLIDCDEDGDWRIYCAGCSGKVMDSHSEPHPLTNDFTEN